MNQLLVSEHLEVGSLYLGVQSREEGEGHREPAGREAGCRVRGSRVDGALLEVGRDEREGGGSDFRKQSCRTVSRNWGWRHDQRVKTKWLQMPTSWPLQAAILKFKGTQSMHSRRHQAAKHNYESILDCHTLECSERALGTALCFLPVEPRTLL